MWKRMLGMCLSCVFLTGCTIIGEETTKLRDLEFTVVSEESLPEELKTMIDEKKSEEFKMTYSDNEFLYIGIGYGEQATGGYSIAVSELYLTENAIYIDTDLIGPSAQDEKTEGASYPYIVVKMEFLDKTVVFE